MNNAKKQFEELSLDDLDSMAGGWGPVIPWALDIAAPALGGAIARMGSIIADYVHPPQTFSVADAMQREIAADAAAAASVKPDPGGWTSSFGDKELHPEPTLSVESPGATPLHEGRWAEPSNEPSMAGDPIHQMGEIAQQQHDTQAAVDSLPGDPIHQMGEISHEQQQQATPEPAPAPAPAPEAPQPMNNDAGVTGGGYDGGGSNSGGGYDGGGGGGGGGFGGGE